MSDRCIGRVAIVTGGTSGIGAAIAERLAVEGAEVVICARSAPAKLSQSRIAFLPADVTHRGDVEVVVAETLSRHGRIDVVVANAGTGGGDPTPEATWSI